MDISFDKKADALYIEFRKGKFGSNKKIDQDTVIDLDEKGKLLGMITFYLLPNIKHGLYRGHIEDVIVTQTARRRGVGSKLLTFVKKYCKDNGIKVIKLDSDHKLIWAHQFYTRNGGMQTELMFRFDI